MVKFFLALTLLLVTPVASYSAPWATSKDAYVYALTSVDGDSQNYSLGINYNFNKYLTIGLEQSFYTEDSNLNYATQFVVGANLTHNNLNFALGSGCGASYGEGKSYGGYTLILSPRLSAKYFFTRRFYLGVDFQYQYFASTYVPNREYLGLSSGFLW